MMFIPILLAAALAAAASESEGVKVLHFHSPTPNGNPETLHGSRATQEPVNPEARDELFRELGLAAETEKMDELEKNVMVQRARAFPAQKLRGLYPKIAAAKLEKLSARLRSKP